MKTKRIFIYTILISLFAATSFANSKLPKVAIGFNAKKAEIINKKGEDINQDSIQITLTGIDHKSQYQANHKQFGYADTDAFIEQWQKLVKKSKKPLLVAFSWNNKVFEAHLVPTKKLGPNSLILHAAEYVNKLKSGTYENINISILGDIPLDLKSIPHSICPESGPMGLFGKCKELPFSTP